MVFALTDFLIVIGAGFGLWRLWPFRKDGRVRMIRLGLIALALAALVGTLRFAAGLEDALAPWHSPQYPPASSGLRRAMRLRGVRAPQRSRSWATARGRQRSPPAGQPKQKSRACAQRSGR